MLTRVSTAGRALSVERFPHETAASPGDAVLWLNGIPGAAVQGVFDPPPPAVGTCRTLPPLPTPYVSPRLGPGGVSVVCFVTPGIFPYRVVIATPEAEAAVRGVVVVRE